MIRILQAPQCEPVSLTSFKTYLHLDHDQFDDLLHTLLLAARERLERAYERALISRTLSLSVTLSPSKNKGEVYPGYAYQLLPGRVALRLPYPPLQYVEQVQVRPSGNGSQNTERPKNIPLETISTNTLREPGVIIIPMRWMPSLIITYRAGYGEDPNHIPAVFKAAILQFAAYLFENRSGSLQDVPSLTDLLSGYEGWRIS